MLALFALYGAFRLERSFKKSVARLELLERNQSTRALSWFPYHLDDITSLISSAQETIRIAGIVSYGATFASSRHAEIMSALRKKGLSGVSIEYVTLSPKTLERMRGLWFNEKNQEEMQDFYEQVRSNRPLSVPDNPSDLLELIKKDNFRSIAQTEDIAAIHYVDELIPVHFWIVDKDRAIFTNHTYSRGNARFAFWTRDRDYIEALYESWEFMRDKYKDDSSTN